MKLKWHNNATKLSEIEDIYRPFKEKKKLVQQMLRKKDWNH